MAIRTDHSASGSTSFPAPSGRLLPFVYLSAIFVSEAILRSGGHELALVLYSLLFLGCLFSAAFRGADQLSLSVAVALVPLIRVLGLVMPLGALDAGYWHASVAIPILVAAALAVRAAGYSREEVGLVLNQPALLVFAAAIPVAVLGGVLSYAVIGTVPIVGRPELQSAILPALAVGLSTGLPEELVFRGLLQRAAIGHLGPVRGVAYGTLSFALVAADPWSLAILAIVLASATCFALMTIATGSILPAAGAHSAFSVTVFLVAPFLLQG